MDEKQKYPLLEWKDLHNKTCLHFTFKGMFTQSDAETAIKEWSKMFDSKKNEKIILIWHCLEMTGYEPMARVIWQRAIKENKSHIDSIWLISNSFIIQAGARILSLVTSYDIRGVKSEKEIVWD